MSTEGSKAGGRGHGRRRGVGGCAQAPVQPTSPVRALGEPTPANGSSSTSLNEAWPILEGGRGRGTRAQAPPQPTPPARALGQAPSNSSYAAVTKAGPSVQLGAATKAGATSTRPSASPDADAGQVRSCSSRFKQANHNTATSSRAVPDEPPVLQDTAGATGLVSSPSRADQPNYATEIESHRRDLNKYLKDNKDHYKKGIHGGHLLVSFGDMIKFNAASSTIRAACSYVKQNSLGAWLIPAVEDFLRDCGYEDMGRNKPCISFSGFPERIQNAKEYGPLVQRVSVFGGQHSVTTLTDNGSILVQTLIVGLLKYHKKGTSWNGSYSADDIHIIKWPSSPSDELNRKPYTYEMKILQKPVEVNGRSQDKAMVGDQRKAAEILKSLYKDFPVYFLELIEHLENTKEVLLKNPWFIEYLTHHPAIMTSTERISFLTNKLHPALSNKAMAYIMQYAPPAYPYDWRIIVASHIMDKNPHLEAVYKFKDGKYGSTAGELIRFMRNVITHVPQYSQHELELYLAKIFNWFLPSIIRTLSVSRKMKEL